MGIVTLNFKKAASSPVAQATVVAGTVAAEKARFKGHCGKILQLLKKGKATNRDLAGISLRYSARIHELRQAGHNIALVSKDNKTGLSTYELRS